MELQEAARQLREAAAAERNAEADWEAARKLADITQAAMNEARDATRKASAALIKAAEA